MAGSARQALRERRSRDACARPDGTGAAREASILDNVIHQRVRLGIASALASGEALSFTRLKSLLDLTDGNLSVHLSKLEQAGYVSSSKSRTEPGSATVSRYRLTASGRGALLAYLSQMEAIIEAARGDGPAAARS